MNSKRKIIIPWGGTAYFSSVYKLFCSIIIDPVNLQEWIWLAEEILQSQKNIHTVQAFKGEHQAIDNILKTLWLYECNLLYYIDVFPAIRTWVRIKDLSFFTHPIAICYLISRIYYIIYIIISFSWSLDLLYLKAIHSHSCQWQLLCWHKSTDDLIFVSLAHGHSVPDADFSEL